MEDKGLLSGFRVVLPCGNARRVAAVALSAETRNEVHTHWRWVLHVLHRRCKYVQGREGDGDALLVCRGGYRAWFPGAIC